jgi:CheY-like chemotaxis protein
VCLFAQLSKIVPVSCFEQSGFSGFVKMIERSLSKRPAATRSRRKHHSRRMAEISWFQMKNEIAKRHILVVDDEASIRESLSMLFVSQGYTVTTAKDGFDGLLQLRGITPDLITSDLNMPNMSGFEFLSVLRRRFPTIPVVAISGAYQCGEAVPGGIIADGFYAKGQQHPEALLTTVAELLKTSAERAKAHQQQSAPVWIPRNGKDSRGIPFIVVTCTECLRSFPMSVEEEGFAEVQETPCLFCPNTVRYIVDFSLGVVSPQKKDPESSGVAPRSAAAKG